MTAAHTEGATKPLSPEGKKTELLVVKIGGEVAFEPPRLRGFASEVKRLATLTAVNLVRIQLMGDDPQRARPY